MPPTICPKCKSTNAYDNRLLNFSAVSCSACGYRSEPVQQFRYTQDDLRADLETLRMAGYGDNDEPF